MATKFDLRHARYERACWWLGRGVAVVPLKPKSKELQPGYGSQLACIVDPNFARQWFLNTDANLGVVLGGPVGLVVGDWDDVPSYESWRRGEGAAIATLIEQTGRGYHAFFLADRLTPATGLGCELKTRGVCMVMPSLHPSGVVYHVVKDAPIAQLDGETARLLFPFLSEAPGGQARKNSHAASVTAVLGKTNAGVCIHSSVVARIKTLRSIADEMRAAGVKLQQGGKVTVVGLCPFHNDHSPSLWVNPESGLWGCNRPNCIAAGIHDVINFRAMRHGISNGAAIRQLADEFL